MTQSAQWKVIHITRSQSNAESLLSALEKEGFMARSRQVSRSLSSQDNYYEIMVPSAEAMEAHQVLIENNLLL